MNWTILPYDITAKAWTDAKFKSTLLETPSEVLLEEKSSLPRDFEFRVWENTRQTTYLPLPARKPEFKSLSEKNLRLLAYEEVGVDCSLRYTLPAEVIVQSFLDEEFRQALIVDTNDTLEETGYLTGGKQIIVIENTDSNYNLALPHSPVETDALSLEKAKQIAMDGVLLAE